MTNSGLIHHIELYVSDLEKTKSFWSWFLCEKLGYRAYQSWDSGISYKLGETYVVFVKVEDRFHSPPYHRCRVGLNHLAFHAESRQQVDEVTKDLKTRGMGILYSDQHPYAGGKNYYAVFFEDPDRIKVELVAPN